MIEIKEKITKLLALADSPNEHEAKAALLKARELMADHKLRPDDISDKNIVQIIKKTVGITCTKMTNAWAVRLSTVIADNYCCRAYRSHARGDRKITIGFVGLEDDFAICEKVFKYAFDCVLSRCRGIRSERKGDYTAVQLRQILNAYGDGFASGVKDAFLEQQKKHQEWGLVLVTPQAVVDVMSNMRQGKPYNQLMPSTARMQFSQEGYRDGQNFNVSAKLEAGQAV